MTTEPVSADPLRRRLARSALPRAEDRTNNSIPVIAPRFVLSTLTLAGADMLAEPVLTSGRTMRRKPREPVWVSALTQGCAVAGMLPAHFRIALPVGHTEIIPDDFIPQLTAAVAEAGISIERLDLEFSESCLTADTDALYYSLAALRDLGVGLVLSGLGSGPTSMTLLRDRVLAGLLTGLKLDRHLPDPSHCETGHVLARAIVQLGRDFGLNTRAEGIDNPQMLAFLRDIGCQEGRGTALGKSQPVPLFLTSHFGTS